MKVSLNWLKDWVDLPSKPEAVAAKLTELGFPVDKITHTGVKVDNVITVQILAVEKHPNADRLQIARVSDGKSERQIVCGAPNIAPDQVVPLAVPGAELPGGFKISVSKIRGVESSGMLCSSRELGISEDHAGIYQFPAKTKLGLPVQKVFPKGDVVFEVDVTPNRPDAMSHYGLARELAVGFKSKRKPSKASWKKKSGSPACSIKIDDPVNCYRYLGKIIHGVKVGPSPDWMVQRLTNCGIRSINNIVDITNYILLEYGHPLHAFDLAKLEGQKIIVRKAKNGESLLALDEKTYKLSSDDLIIADQKNPVAIAGVMGGQTTGVVESTTDILLESAVFNRVAVRRTSRKLALKSESSIRFEKGTDAKTAEQASLRAAQLILELAGGTPGSSADAYPKKQKSKKVTLRLKRLTAVLGDTIPVAETKKILSGLGFAPVKKADSFVCDVPLHRKDVYEEADLIEEAVRVYGYNNVKSVDPQVRAGHVPPDQVEKDLGPLIEFSKGAGLNQTMTSSFSAVELLKAFGIQEDRMIPLANPLSQEETVMRSLLVPNLVRAVKRNINYQRDAVFLFEIGHRFSFDKGGQIKETKVFSAVFYGTEQNKTWATKEKSVDFYTLKGFVEGLNARFNLGLSFNYEGGASFLHPHQSFDLMARGQAKGWGGLLHPSLAESMDLKSTCGVVEFEVDWIAFKPAVAEPVSDFPFVERDVALIVGKDKSWSDLQSIVLKNGGTLLRDVTPFDVFSGGNIPSDKKSLAFRMTIQSDEKTLSESEINQVVDKIKGELRNKVGAELR